MKQTDCFLSDMLDFDNQESARDLLWTACKPVSAVNSGNDVILEVPFQAQKKGKFEPDDTIPVKVKDITVRAYGDSIIRLTACFGGKTPVPDSGNVMLEWDPSLKQDTLKIRARENGWDIHDSNGVIRMKVETGGKSVKKWSTLIRGPYESFYATVFPDGKSAVPFMPEDAFTPDYRESLSLGFVERDGAVDRSTFSLFAGHNEKFAGTGERFCPMNLAGRTFILENTDALGTNSRRAYKNVPFYVSSRPYGMLMLTSAHVRISLADISTRAVISTVEDDILDLFFLGGTGLERIIYNYRRLTGFPKDVPLWSYGTWMSRMTYFSARETIEIAKRLREEDFPCDVIHLDTGWFKEDWKCEWEFNPVTFPDPEKYMKEMKENGFRVTLWQNPTIGKNTKHYETARKKRYIAPIKASGTSGSDFGNVQYGGKIDFTNPEAVKWYQGLLENLLRMGASAIKTDFGEKVDQDADYYGMPCRLLHNIYGLLYQKAAYDITEKVTGEGIIWARAGWTGCQRYPVHWGGDCACTWDGLAGSIRGGLHLGVSGFAFWSHDVPGFYGVPDFMNSRPEDNLYIRWTQVGVFTSHLRYHGTSPREPYEYPGAAPIVRKWLKLRYALIPYLVNEGRKAVESGFPIFRAMILHHERDPFCWNIDDQFYCGDNLLIAPVLNDEGIRDVYLPEGKWTDLWSGSIICGPILLRDVRSSPERIPVYARTGSKISVYPYNVECTDEMDLNNAAELCFDGSFRGLSESLLGEVTGL